MAARVTVGFATEALSFRPYLQPHNLHCRRELRLLQNHLHKQQLHMIKQSRLRRKQLFLPTTQISRLTTTDPNTTTTFLITTTPVATMTTSIAKDVPTGYGPCKFCQQPTTFLSGK